MAANTIVGNLQRLQANGTVFYQKLRHFHWCVKGPGFFRLHQELEKLYNHWSEFIDDVAERIVQFNAAPLATLSSVLQQADIKEAAEAPAARRMVEEVVADLTAQLATMRETCRLAEQSGDRTTGNLLDGYADAAEKAIWMHNAWLAG